MDDEEAALQAQIAKLAGRINRAKSGEPHQPQQATRQFHSGWVPQRGTPYGVHRGRGHSSPRAGGYRNRSLIMNQSSAQAERPTLEVPDSSAHAGSGDFETQSGWVTKNDRHMQLINNNVYEQKARARNIAIEETRQKKELEREEREKIKLSKYLQRSSGNGNVNTSSIRGTSTPHQIYVKGIRFIVAEEGSKLIKASDEANLALITPKRANVGGVTFIRSKHGNLYRAGLVKMTRTNKIQKLSQLCLQFTSTGFCAKGPNCRYTHDPQKVAICRDFLQTGKCPAGEDCDLSHDPTPERVPACVHFVRGNCTNPNCRYAHVKTSSSAPVCRDFATLGYCSKGIKCAEKHVHECPDYANKGFCRKPKCPLPHVDRAGQLRKVASNETSTETAADDDASSDASSDAELDSDDFDSDGIEENLSIPTAAEDHELSQQKDYVAL